MTGPEESGHDELLRKAKYGPDRVVIDFTVGPAGVGPATSVVPSQPPPVPAERPTDVDTTAHHGEG